MARPQVVSDRGIADVARRDDRPTRTWNGSHGMYVAGRAYLDQADMTASEMDAKWGVDRLRRLVGPELRERFDRQRYLHNQAIWHGDLEDVRREANRMVKALLALDREAERLGATRVEARVWEVGLDDGTVAAIVPDGDHARLVSAEGRRVNVYTLEEIGRLLSRWPELAKIKAAFPGAEIVAARNRGDPLQALMRDDVGLDEPLVDDEIPF